jgi:hypothetical protein
LWVRLDTKAYLVPSGYNCEKDFPLGGNICDGKGCCCVGPDGTGLQTNMCNTSPSKGVVVTPTMVATRVGITKLIQRT